MRTFSLFIIFYLFIRNATAQFQFLSPAPGSKYQNTDRNIIIRNGSLLKSAALQKKKIFEINGSRTGSHKFEIVLCRDKKTILLNPLTPFADAETVTVIIRAGIEKETGETIKGFTFSFETNPKLSPQEVEQLDRAREEIYENEFAITYDQENSSDKFDQKGLPPFKITVNTNPAPGDIFFHNYNNIGVATGRRSIITNDGDSIYSRRSTTHGIDFKINHNGYITLFNKVTYIWEMYDSSYNKVGSYKMQNGYLTDLHDFQIFPDGHCFLMAYDTRFVDMSVYDSSYYTHATVTGLVIEELDSDKNVIFDWRSWDHISILEARHQNLASGVIDYVHGNSLEQDMDGNLIISCRHLDQVNKIDINTGEFIWRLGGLNNEFTFINDADTFNYQHDCRRLPNGHLTLFDNGNWHSTPCSFAREYELDEVNKSATLFWYYKHSKVGGACVFGGAGGSVQRLENGNTFINWGFVSPGTNFPNITEVTNNGDIVWEMRLNTYYSDVIYRAHKYEWNPCARPTGINMKAKDVEYHLAKLIWSPSTSAVSYNVQYRVQGNLNWNYVSTFGTLVYLNQLNAGTTYEWRLQGICGNGDSSVFSNINQFTTLSMRTNSHIGNQELIVYPNPAAGNLNIRLPAMKTAFEIRLLNGSSVAVYQHYFESLDDRPIIKIPIEKYPAGVYTITVINSDYYQRKMVVIE